MNRNKNNEISEISSVLAGINDNLEIECFMTEILTKAELDALSKRWRLMNLLKQGYTQREIAKELKMSLCKITRGAKILKSKKSIVAKCLLKEN